MLEPKFVLVLLIEIKSTILNIEKQKLFVYLQNCSDTSDICVIEEKLGYLITIPEKYN